MKTFNRVFTVIVFLFLYIPMIVLAVASFNAGTDIAVWKGFTFAQYGALFRDGVLLPLLANSVIVAVIASLVATVLGTMAAIGIRAMSGRMRRITMAVTNIPLTNPEIVTGVSLALLFAFAGQMMKLNNVLGFTTLLIAHITFNLPYVILSVMPKLGQLDPNLLDAALDLGGQARRAGVAVRPLVRVAMGAHERPRVVKNLQKRRQVRRRGPAYCQLHNHPLPLLRQHRTIPA